MNFDVDESLNDFLGELDTFIEQSIVPLEQANPEFLDHRREWARTNWEEGGVPAQAWEDLLDQVRDMSDAAGFYRYSLPVHLGGAGASNLSLVIVREHLARRGLGLHADLQSESSIVAQLPFLHIVDKFGTEAQRQDLLEGMIDGTRRVMFALTESDHGSDATWMETRATRDENGWVINGSKRWNTGAHTATHEVVFARSSGADGSADGITAFLIPMGRPGMRVASYDWTFNMPTDHAQLELDELRADDGDILGAEGQGLRIAQYFVHENRIRQAAASLGAAQFCIDQSVARARTRVTFGQALSHRQAIQWTLVELHTEAEMVRGLVRKAAWMLDRADEPTEVGPLISMANYRANRLACDAADSAIQVHGGEGYSRHLPFEHIYRHHRRYRITEGSDEIQIRKIAGHLFGFTGRSKPEATS